MKSNDLSFSKDVADTIGIEAAIILKFIEDNKITSNSLEDISEIILEKFSFMEEQKIISSIEKIAGLGLIKIKFNKYKKVNLKIFIGLYFNQSKTSNLFNAANYFLLFHKREFF